MADDLTPPDLDVFRRRGTDNWQSFLRMNLQTLSDRDLKAINEWAGDNPPTALGPDLHTNLREAIAVRAARSAWKRPENATTAPVALIGSVIVL